MGQVILGTLVVLLHDGRAHLGRRDGEDGADHPVGSAPAGIEAHEGDVLIGNAAEEALHVFYLKRLLHGLVACILALHLIPLGNDARNALALVAIRLS